MSFVHLHTHTPFSFLDGGSSIEELVARAASFDMPALAVTDHDNLCAAVKFNHAACAAGIKPLQGTEITLENGSHLVLLARNCRGYISICRLLTRSHLDHSRGEPRTHFECLEQLEDVIALSGCRRGELASLILAHEYPQALQKAREYLCLLGRENFFIELQDNLLPGTRYLNHRLLELAETLGIETVATNNVHYASRQEFIIHDLLSCIRTLSRVDEINPCRPLNGENYLKSPREMKELFCFYPRAIENTLHIAGQCEPVFREQKFHFPLFPLESGQSAAEKLRDLAFTGARYRYGSILRKVADRLESELEVIIKLGFADYFLAVWDLADFARREGIRYAGRGSAADSLVAYCLFITDVDSLKRGLLFERFMSLERKGLPDIDIDFEARRRDRVIEYVYDRYGEERVARVATYNTFQARSAIREIGKALGFDEEELGNIAKRIPHTHADNIRKMLGLLPELQESSLKEERCKLLLDVCEKIAGFPRFLGTHLGGVVISDVPLVHLAPLQRSALGPVITQFDKDDVEALGLAKLDLLSLRTLSVIGDARSSLAQTGIEVDYERIPLDDRATYEMIRRGETIGVFQLESPAQRALQARLEASHMEDMVASMALIRPGPIKGNMVDPYIARRQGKEAVSYLHPLLKPILEKTYGVVLFQEQVIEIAIAVAGFSAGEADQLRRVMTHARSRKDMEAIGEKFMARAIEKGIAAEVAGEIFSYIGGYASYGFCEAHAAAFATTSYKTAYLIRHYPAQYFAAILNNQPMGYYPPAIICLEARRRGVKMLPPDVNHSGINFSVEGGKKIRTGLKQVKGMSRKALETILQARSHRAFSNFADFVDRTLPDSDIAENLIKCGALDSLEVNRRRMLSELPARLEMARSRSRGEEILFDESEDYFPSFQVGDFTTFEKALLERSLLGIDIDKHIMAFYRSELQRQHTLSSREINKLPGGRKVKAAGLLLHPHRPPTRSGRITVFFSLEDEFGLVDVTMFEDRYMRYGQYVFGERPAPLLVKGTVHRRGNGVSVVADEVSFLTID